MRRRLLLAAAFLPIPIALSIGAAMPGCGSEEFEDICGWLKDPNGCYRSFHVETGDRCGARGAGNGPVGTFASRDKLDVCFLDDGGQVVFDPPLDLANFPLTSVAFTRLDDQAAECGAAEFNGQFSYSMTINGCNDADVDAGSLCSADKGTADAGVTVVTGGTVAITTPDGRDVYDVSCSDGTTHHFNRLDIEKCTSHDQLLPQAEIVSKAGAQPPPTKAPDEVGAEFEGVVQFRVYYPPTVADVNAMEIPAETQPDIVEYFNCVVPAAAPLCANGVKDGAETDIDCGGAVCEANKCISGQSCTRVSDCVSGLTCQVGVDSFRTCQ